MPRPQPTPFNLQPTDIPRILRVSTGCSSARLERTVRDREVEGSNPFTPTPSFGSPLLHAPMLDSFHRLSP